MLKLNGEKLQIFIFYIKINLNYLLLSKKTLTNIFKNLFRKKKRKNLEKINKIIKDIIFFNRKLTIYAMFKVKICKSVLFFKFIF